MEPTQDPSSINAAAAMAASLIQLPAVHAVQFVEIPPNRADRDLFSIIKARPQLYRLLVIADDELVARYMERIRVKSISGLRPGESPETPGEVALALLDTDMSSFCAGLDTDEETRLDATLALSRGMADIVLLPEEWVHESALLESIRRARGSGALKFPIFRSDTVGHIIQNHQIFDPETRTFVSPR